MEIVLDHDINNCYYFYLPTISATWYTILCTIAIASHAYTICYSYY